MLRKLNKRGEVVFYRPDSTCFCLELVVLKWPPCWATTCARVSWLTGTQDGWYSPMCMGTVPRPSLLLKNIRLFYVATLEKPPLVTTLGDSAKPFRVEAAYSFAFLYN